MKHTLFSVLALAALALASPLEERNSPSYSPSCVSQEEANTFVQNFADILGHKNSSLGTPAQAAEILIASNFAEYSNSILSLEGAPLNGTGESASSKAEWINGVVKYGGYSGIETLQVLVACDQVVWYWQFNGIGSAKYPIKGFNLFKLIRSDSCLQVEALYLEFDSIAWGADTGQITCTAHGGEQK